MNVREVRVSRTVRVNTGNYEGTEHHVSMVAELDELDVETIEAEKLSALVDEAMVRQLVRSYRVRGKKDMTLSRIKRHHGLEYGDD